MNQSQVTELRQRYPRFIYEKYEVSLQDRELKLQFFFTIEPDLHFVTTVLFHDLPDREIDIEVVKTWAFHLGLVEALSYWKATCSPHFVVRAGYLHQDQVEFWRNLVHKGMSEFFFVNQVNGWEPNFLQFEIECDEKQDQKDHEKHQDVFIVPVGGGKDSVVTLELLKQQQLPIHTFTITPSDQVKEVLKVTGIDKNILVTRQLDPIILQLNGKGFLNGHTPFSSMVSFVSTLAAYLHDCRFVALSNEFSANEGNTLFLGQQINHQYTKTLEYETAFRAYCRNYLSDTIEYFSFLRPLHELQIAGIFTQFPQYFSVFLSCNRGQKTGQWCGECPKCLFVYIMLSAFLDPEQLHKIFGQDLFAKDSLTGTLNELSGVTECKSLECVGTRQETIIALAMAINKYQSEKKPLPVLLQYAQQHISAVNQVTPAEIKSFLSAFQTQHFVPDFLLWKLIQQVERFMIK